MKSAVDIRDFLITSRCKTALKVQKLIREILAQCKIRLKSPD